MSEAGIEDVRGAEPGRRKRPFDVTNRMIWAITIPMTFAFLTTPLIGLTDVAVVGRVGDAVALGGLTVGALIFDFAFATCNFIRSGTTGLTAQALGAEDGREGQAVFWRAAILAFGIGLFLIFAEPLIVWLGLLAVSPGEGVAETVREYVFVRMFSAPFALLNYAILGYVLGLGRGNLGLALQIVVNGVNIVLSILFGLVLGWGIFGVALGTVCGEAAGALVGLIVVLRGFDPNEKPSRRRIMDRTGFTRMIAVNRDIMIRSFCLLSAFTLFARFGAGFGAVTLAANGILMNFFMVGGYFLDGMATASEQLAGRSIGANWQPAFERALRLTILWGFLLAGVLSAIFLIGGEALIAFLATDSEVRAEAGAYLVFAALTPLAGSLAFIMDGIFIGATWSRTMRNMMIASLAVFIICANALVPVFGNTGLWIAMLVFLGARGFLLLAFTPYNRDRAFASV
ncbi:Sodium:dicarboxylate symporter:Multi antimicrobial extrusion protein MatE [Fulvimarina pelagi HTCC2506]|uniref:Sodium:dicarboxylate symporter:Multi antimicrobial extrusion protein MatE n=1 Tax=Fulvimarina pelagi HTCC2506 TaxID=314231 RepID=Q0G3J1_9HYPH|nr:MATE family efflux transporter [Fulvimarina pelagi]EAU41840.1 Sodium:dicarboxylate symporter:Multi antimicrobial extrusion protein MatE [Fulvimarina pelagi HTCC2506]